MPVPLVVMMFIAATIMLIGAYLEEHSIVSKNILTLLVFVSFTWFLVSVCQPKAYFSTTEHKVEFIDNVAAISVDNQIINLNETTKRQYKEGDVVICKRPYEMYFGVWYKLDRDVKVKNVEKNN